jgi:pimeloyl-ACP methyl ester carboxylesterase
MTRLVHVHGECAAAADDIWRVAGAFCGLWHPAMATVSAEQSGRVRRFTVKDEDTIYREELTYFSNADRTYHYRHLAGIRDVVDYRAALSVTPLADSRCRIDWHATIVAGEPRAAEIADGTRLVFEMGIAALQNYAPRSAMVPGAPQLALTAVGVASETLCLFLHGIGGGRLNWARQLPVAGAHLQAAAMDLRGYGETELGLAPSTVDDYCDDILRVLDYFGAKRLVLCGLSYGSWIATSFAMRYPEKLRGLVLSGGCLGMSEASSVERERFRLAREVPLNEGKSPADFASDVVAMIASPGASAEVRDELHLSMAAIPALTYRDALQCFTKPREQFDFSKLNMPVLLMTGEYDRLASPAEIRSVALRINWDARNPDVRFEVLPEAGHVCNLEQPDAYNALLDEFLRGLL